MKRKVLAISMLVLTSILMVFATGCASCSREWKTMQSDLGGGLHRTVTVYDYNGNPIKSWFGKFDISNSENEVFFDINNKRVIIHGGIVISEEN